MEKILERVKALNGRLVGFYDSGNDTYVYKCAILVALLDATGEPAIYAVYLANPDTGKFHHRKAFYGDDAATSHRALNEFCDRCHKLHP